MSELLFQDHGRLYGRRRKHSLFLSQGGESIPAWERNNLDSGSTVWVVPGGRVQTLLPAEQSRLLVDFSTKLQYADENASRNEISCWKRYKSLRAFTGRKWITRVVPVAWKFGPIPAIQIGTVDGIPVCASPIPTRKAAVQASLLEDEVVLEVIGQYFGPCVDNYLADAFDILRCAFFHSGRDRALFGARKLTQIIRESIEPKLQMIEGKRDKGNRKLRQIKNQLSTQYQHEIAVTKAAVGFLKTAVEILQYAGGVEHSMPERLREAQELVANVSSDYPERQYLEDCIDLLVAPTGQESDLRVIEYSTQFRKWIPDMITCTKVMSAVLAQLKNSEYKIFVFLSFHMDVYASETFYERFRRLVAGRWHGKVEVWTGDGPTDHILNSIIAKIWLSDGHALYFPNNMGTIQGSCKVLKTENDWLVEELFHRHQTRQSMSFIVAQNDNHDHGCTVKLDDFIQQFDDYDWDTIHAPLKTEDVENAGGRLATKVKANLRHTTYTKHRPRRNRIDKDDAQSLEAAIVRRAVTNRFESLIRGVRLGITKHQWRVFQELNGLFKSATSAKQAEGFNAEEIATRLRCLANWNGPRIDRKWVLRTLAKFHRQCLSIVIGGQTVRLVKNSDLKRPVFNQKAYWPNRDAVIAAFAEYYGITAEKDLQRMRLAYRQIVNKAPESGVQHR